MAQNNKRLQPPAHRGQDIINLSRKASVFLLLQPAEESQTNYRPEPGARGGGYEAGVRSTSVFSSGPPSPDKKRWCPCLAGE